MTLDSTYEVRDLDPWYLDVGADGADRVRRGLRAQPRRAARRRPARCWARIGSLAEYLRAHPVSGWTTGTDAAPLHVTVDVRALVDMVNDAGYDYAQYRTLDAAGRALLDDGDPAPLLRQYAQDLGWDLSDYTGTDPTYYSDGVYYAVACTDYPQLFSMTATPAQRRAQLAAAEAALPAGTFAPFTPAEWVQVNQYTEAYTACLDWPAPVHHDPPLPSATAPLDPGGVPVLVLNGDLDSLTPALGRRARRRADRVRPRARWSPRTWSTWSRSTTGTAAARRCTGRSSPTRRRWLRSMRPACRRSLRCTPWGRTRATLDQVVPAVRW